MATLLAKDVKIRDPSGGSKKTYQEAGWIWSAHPVSHHAVSVFKDPLARSVHYERRRWKEPERRGFSHFPSNVPSLPNSRERDSAVVISASLPSRWVPYLKWEKAIMASVWITTDYNNGRAAAAIVTAAAGDKRMPGIFSPSSSSSSSSFPSRVNRTRGAKS